MTNKKSLDIKPNAITQEWPHWLSIAIFSIVAFGLWIFNQAYLTPLLLGFIFAALSYPIYSFIASKIKFKRIRSGLAGIITVITISAGVIGLVNVMTRELIKEVPKFGTALVKFLDEVPTNTTIVNFASGFGFNQDDLKGLVEQIKTETTNTSVLQNTSQDTKNFSELFSQDNISTALDVSRQAFSYIFTQLIYLVIFYLAWYNGLVHGKKWLDDLFEITPLEDDEVDSIKKDLTMGIRNVIYASLLSGTIHTVAVIIIMLIFGLPNISIVAIAVFLIGLLPVSPSEIGYAIPILLLFPINPLAAIILIPICELIILYTNYVLLPQVIAGGEEGNPLLILTSIFSGLVIFGIMGFIIAPVLMILIQTLYKILVKRIRIEKGDIIETETGQIVTNN
jgi:predicted PurR-regulated permease PerM